MRYVLVLVTMIISMSSSAGNNGYDPEADPYQDFRKSMVKAKADNKLLLVVFGSDWCPDCRSFNKKLGENPLSETIDSKFVVMHVDVGQWDKNIKFTEAFGKPIAKGIPSIAIVGNDRSLFYVAQGGEFASARKSKVKSINDWFVSIGSKISKTVADAKEGKPGLPTAKVLID